MILIKAFKRITAWLLGRKAPTAVVALRKEICASCDKVAHGPDFLYCSLCGCRIENLTVYEERLPMWGCKHPDRASGKGWPAR